MINYFLEDSNLSKLKPIILVISIFTLLFTIKSKAYWFHDYKYILGIENEYDWQKNNGVGRGYSEFRDANLDLNKTTKLILGVDYYNVESEKLKFVSTESEYFNFINSTSKLQYCRSNHFKYVFLTNKFNLEPEFELMYSNNNEGLPIYIYQLTENAKN